MMSVSEEQEMSNNNLNEYSNVYEYYWNELTDGQKQFLSSLSNKESWYKYIASYSENGEWDILQNKIGSYDKYLTYDDFHYLGKNMTFINNDIDKINQLNYLKYSIINKIPNRYYQDMAKRIFIDYRINSISFKKTKAILVNINNTM